MLLDAVPYGFVWCASDYIDSCTVEDPSLVWADAGRQRRYREIVSQVRSWDADLPSREGVSVVPELLNRITPRFPRPPLWLLVGAVALVVRRPRGTRTVLALWLAAGLVLLVHAVSQGVAPEFALPLYPVFIVTALAAVAGNRRPRCQTPTTSRPARFRRKVSDTRRGTRPHPPCPPVSIWAVSRAFVERGAHSVRASISVIVNTHERPRALDAVLRALSDQSDPGFDVVVADDGSGPETDAVVERWTTACSGRESSTSGSRTRDSASHWPAIAARSPPAGASSCSWTATRFRGLTSCGRCGRECGAAGSWPAAGSSSRER